VIPVSVPPLRDRIGDIPLLAESFFHRVQLKSGKKIQGISKEALKLLMEYPWPGNVRELKSAFEYVFVSCREAMIHPDHFPPNIAKASKVAQSTSNNFENLNDMRRRELIEALRKSNGNQSEAARILGVSRVTVWKRMKQFDVNSKPKYDL
jgi:transcriptional regulator with PAS, ATPase and Fis domain